MSSLSSCSIFMELVRCRSILDSCEFYLSPDPSQFSIWWFIWRFIGFHSTSPCSNQWLGSATSISSSWIHWFTFSLLLIYLSKCHKILIQPMMTKANAMPQIIAKGKHNRHLDKALNFIISVDLVFALLCSWNFNCFNVALLQTFDRISLTFEKYMTWCQLFRKVSFFVRGGRPPYDFFTYLLV